MKEKFTKIFLTALIAVLVLCLPYMILFNVEIDLIFKYVLLFLFFVVLTEGIIYFVNPKENTKTRIKKIIGCFIIGIVISKIILFVDVPYACDLPPFSDLPTDVIYGIERFKITVFELSKLPNGCTIDYNVFLQVDFIVFFVIKMFFGVLEVVSLFLKIRKNKTKIEGE